MFYYQVSYCLIYWNILIVPFVFNGRLFILYKILSQLCLNNTNNSLIQYLQAVRLYHVSFENIFSCYVAQVRIRFMLLSLDKKVTVSLYNHTLH